MMLQMPNDSIITHLPDRRVKPFIRSRKRTKFDRRTSFRAGSGILALVQSGDATVGGTLVNISDSGACIELPQSETRDVSVVQVGIPLLHNKIINCETAWSDTRRDTASVRFGIKFIGLNGNDKAHLRKRILLNEQILLQHAEDVAQKADDVAQQQEIKTFFLIDVRKALEHLIEIDASVAHSAHADELATRCKEALDQLAEAGDALDTVLDNPCITKDIKQRVRALLGHFLYQSQVFRRALEKPRGYPGDYQMLEMAYDNREVSNGIGYYLDRYGLDRPYSEAIRKRKDMMRDILQSYITNSPCRDLKILNLASGACREIRELLNESVPCTRHVDLKCIDQDEEAIAFSHNKLADLDTGHMDIDLIKGNILRLEELDLGGDNSFDLIYSIGIADYLQDRMLTKIFQDCYHKLKKGGKLVIAYKDRERNKPLAFNWYGDWNFVPRNEEELLDMIYDAMGKDNISIHITRESTGIIFFADITKER